MGIISQKEVKDKGPVIRLILIMTLVFTLTAIILFYGIPTIKRMTASWMVEKDIETIERVHNALQEIMNEGGGYDIPSAIWNASLSDIETLSSCEGLRKALKEKLGVKNLNELEGENFRSGVFKGNSYVIRVDEGSTIVHLSVSSNLIEVHEDIVY